MTDTVRYPLVLGLIALTSAAGLAFSYALTRDEIRRQRELEKDRGLAAVFGIEFDERASERPWRELCSPSEGNGTAGPRVFAATDAKSGHALYAALGSARGYSSRVEAIVAVDEIIRSKPEAAHIRAVKIVYQGETPGMGDQCQTPAFQAQFDDLLVAHLDIKKDAPYRVAGAPGSEEQEIAAITGATITSNAVIAAVRKAIDRIRERAAQQPNNGPGKTP